MICYLLIYEMFFFCHSVYLLCFSFCIISWLFIALILHVKHWALIEKNKREEKQDRQITYPIKRLIWHWLENNCMISGFHLFENDDFLSVVFLCNYFVTILLVSLCTIRFCKNYYTFVLSYPVYKREYAVFGEIHDRPENKHGKKTPFTV